MEFDAARRELIEAVLEPLEGKESIREILEMTAASGAGDTRPETQLAVLEATGRMRRSGGAFLWRKRGGFTLLAAAILVVLWMALLRPAAREEFAAIELVGRAEFYLQSMDELQAAPFLLQSNLRRPSFDDSLDAAWAEMYERQKARMGGRGTILEAPFRPGAGRFREEVKEAWERSPADPGLYFRYARSLGHDGPSGLPRWPPDLVREGERLDPENGLFRICRATELADQSVYRNYSTPGYGVNDPELLAEAMQTLEAASALPRWDDYRQALYRRESVGWPAARDLPDQVFATLVFHPSILEYHWYDSRDLELVIQAWLETAAKDPDPSTLERAGEKFAELRRRWAAVETNYQGREFQLSLIKAGAQALSAAYELRHEIEKADRYAGIVREMQAFDIPYVPGELYASGYLAIRAPEASEPEIGMPGSAGKRAGRLAEYAMWERFTFHLVAGVLALLGGALLLAPRLVRRDAGALPERLGHLLTIGDRMALLIAGLAVPAAVYFGCTRLLPGRGEYLSFWKFLLMLSQAMGMVAAMAFLTAALARLILVRRGAALGFLKAGAKMDLVFASLSLGLIAIACFVPPALSPLYQEPYEGGFAGVMFAFPVLWAGFRTYGWIAAPPERRVLQAALLRACAPVMVVGALLSVLAIAELHAWENQLVSRMTTGSMTAPEMTLAAPSQQARADSCRRAILKTLDP